MPRGRLKVFLGVAPGAGKTHALLDEAGRRAARGAHLVLAVDTRGRSVPDVAAATVRRLDGALAIPVEQVLSQHPSVVLVDDLHRDNPPGSRHPHRWQDVEALLDAGLDVVTAVDVRFVASLADEVEAVTGLRPRTAVPDRLLRDAEQLQLVDIDPHALRRRLAHGGLYPAEGVDAAVSATYRLPVLAALRELALGWTLGAVAARHPPAVPADAAPGPGREKLLVGLSGGPETERVLRRAARLASRFPGAELHAVHVLSGRRLPGTERLDAAALRALAADVGAGYQQVIGHDVAAALAAVAEADHATQLVLGSDAPSGRLRQRVARLVGGLGGDTAARLLVLSPGLDVHVVATGRNRAPMSLPPLALGLPRRRRAAGLVVGAALPVLLTVGLTAVGPRVGLAGDSLVLLLAVVVTALLGGLWPALVSAVIGSTLLNYFFIPPLHTLRVSESHNVITLVVFVLVAALVSAVVQRAATLAARAARSSAESRSLAAMAGGVLRGEEALPTLLEHVRSAFGMTSASLLERVAPSPDAVAGAGSGAGTVAGWRVVQTQGAEPPALPVDADVAVPAGDNLVLALSGRTLAAGDRTMLRAFAAQAQGLLERDRLTRTAAHAARLEASERLRDALLAALGHDLRTPLASARAAVNSLQASDVTWTGQERRELLATADESLERLTRLVSDLLDLSRLRAGVLTVTTEPVWIDDLVPPALDELGVGEGQVQVQVSPDVPPLLADPALLTRALVNVIGNALRHARAGGVPVVSASSSGDRVEVRVIDRGDGVAEQDKERIFVPFQRLGDTDNTVGLGLGLALSRGLLEAMGGTVQAQDTPGGGLTVVLTLPAALDEALEAAEPGLRERDGGRDGGTEAPR